MLQLGHVQYLTYGSTGSQTWQIRTWCYIQVGTLCIQIYTHLPPPLMKFLSTTGYNRPSLNPTHTHPNKNQSKLVSAHILDQTFHTFIRSKRPLSTLTLEKKKKKKTYSYFHSSPANLHAGNIALAGRNSPTSSPSPSSSSNHSINTRLGFCFTGSKSTT